MTEIENLLASANNLLQPQRFKDYGPNGLQVEGKSRIECLVSGVTASLALIEAAIESGADAILVHHGLFWRGQTGCVTGWLRQRLAMLLKHDINLLAYHLPLDAHPSLGNNAQLGQSLGWKTCGTFGDQELGVWGESSVAYPTTADLVRHIEQVLHRKPLLVQPAKHRPIKKIGWCSGGAQGYFEAAIEAGVDVFITGEISEPQAHLARETGVAFLACGHHATEQGGARAVGQYLAEEFGLQYQFINIENPA